MYDSFVLGGGMNTSCILCLVSDGAAVTTFHLWDS